MKSSTASPSTKRTDRPDEAGPGAAGAAFGPVSARAAPAGGRPEVPPHVGLPRHTWLFAPACGVLIALCAVLAGWHNPVPPVPAGFDLRTAPASFNVDSNSAGAAGADPAPPPRQPLDTSRTGQEDSEPHVTIGPVPEPPSEPKPAVAAPGGVQTAEPPAISEPTKPPGMALPPLPPPPPLSGPPLTLGPLLPPAEPSESHRDSQRGDSTMPQMKILGLPIALAAVLTAQPLAKAGDVEKLEKPVTQQDVRDLKNAQEKSFKEMMEEIRSLRDQLRAVDGIRKDVDGLKTTVQSINVALELTTQNLKAKNTELAETQATLKQVRDDLEKARAQAGKMQDQIAAHSARCDGLTEELTDLRKRLNDTSRQAARLTEATGTIHLYNTYGQPVSIVLNGRSYQLDPGESHTLSNQPVGPVTYEVLGLSPRTIRTLTADRPLDIEVADLARGPIKISRP